MSNHYDGFDDGAAYDTPYASRGKPSFMKIKPSEIGNLTKEQIINACKKIYPENFV
jgi:hypothetical protein